MVSQEQLDVLYVVRGMLRIEFADDPSAARTLGKATCRSYRWPRDASAPATFLAVSPGKDHDAQATDHAR